MTGALEVINNDYVRAARAKGLSEWTVIRRHVMRPALLSIATVAALAFGNLLSGTVLVEAMNVERFGREQLHILSLRHFDHRRPHGFVGCDIGQGGFTLGFTFGLRIGGEKLQAVDGRHFDLAPKRIEYPMQLEKLGVDDDQPIRLRIVRANAPLFSRAELLLTGVTTQSAPSSRAHNKPKMSPRSHSLAQGICRRSSVPRDGVSAQSKIREQHGL